MERSTNILLAVTGLTPQVITEAVYGLMMQGRLVHEVHAITTGEGGDLIHARLLASGIGALFRLQADYGLPPIQFPPENICNRFEEAIAALKPALKREITFLLHHLMTLASERGLACIAEFSGGKGYHLRWTIGSHPCITLTMGVPCLGVA